MARTRPAAWAWLLALVWIGVPTAWLLVAGVLGTKLRPDAAIAGTAVIFVLVFVALPLTVVGLSKPLVRRQLRPQAGGPFPRIRRPQLRHMRPPPVPEAPRLGGSPADFRRKLAAATVLALMFALGFAVWTLVPLGWLWIGSQLAETQQPEMGPYALIVIAIPTTIMACLWALGRLNGLHTRLVNRPTPPRARPAWLKSLGGERQRRAWTTVDAVMTVSVIAALLCLLIWFSLFADPRSIAESYLD